jgi:predicted enzyme related to lactoylglutathione lyase
LNRVNPFNELHIAAASSLPLPKMRKRKLKPERRHKMTEEHSAVVSVRYMIDDVNAAVAFYTKHLGFTLEMDAAPAFAAVTRGNLRLPLSGEKSSGRKAMPDGTKPAPGGWNRILLEVTDIKAEAARLHAAGVKFRRDDIVSGPGALKFGSLILPAISSSFSNPRNSSSE